MTDPTDLTAEALRTMSRLIADLAKKGVALRAAGLGEASGLHGIVKRKGGYEGGADPRREGVARGY
jgi:gamma-glutamyltranspeptidase/glutathione hydrolase